MQHLFSGKLRFKDDTSAGLSAGNGKNYPDWEEKRLGKVLKYYDNAKIWESSPEILNQKYPHKKRMQSLTSFPLIYAISIL